MRISLAAARINAGMKVREVCDRLEITRQTLRMWERGKTRIKPVYVEALCRMYGCTPDDIFLPGDFTKS